MLCSFLLVFTSWTSVGGGLFPLSTDGVFFFRGCWSWTEKQNSFSMCLLWHKTVFQVITSGFKVCEGGAGCVWRQIDMVICVVVVTDGCSYVIGKEFEAAEESTCVAVRDIGGIKGQRYSTAKFRRQPFGPALIIWWVYFFFTKKFVARMGIQKSIHNPVMYGHTQFGKKINKIKKMWHRHFNLICWLSTFFISQYHIRANVRLTCPDPKTRRFNQRQLFSTDLEIQIFLLFGQGSFLPLQMQKQSILLKNTLYLPLWCGQSILLCSFKPEDAEEHFII